ncbi:uncharacterized protein MELLADRAFT_62104 [Melampsora larici-populina 98AG31]|uniref:DUF6589 domain-containing protein n=1 Tax=Melampsora larici-populina (strain 98AG31 / pathotype 3-4-7) TaxID=747676 RepID=F4RHK8_MELLP|nr:uncharacterized protein MELLADRAFT_62104 [Melampsora larici-populina 98AG31]EGG08120.1 hypothetical protein MELLADRAFT_62104 [Melampsora larici-populina 98AG31]
MCNGSWGYIHRPKIPEGIPLDHDVFTAENLQAILNKSEQQPISITDITPTPAEIKDWNLTLKSQISHVLIKYVAQPIDGKMIPYRYPPEVKQLPTEKPDIMMLKMMSALDNSTAGVGDLYNAVLHQTGLSKEKRVMKLNVETVGKDRVKMTPERMMDVIDETFNRVQELPLNDSETYIPLIFLCCVTLNTCIDQSVQLRELLHRLKGRSGLNDVYQSHKNTIDHSTLRTFLRMAHQHQMAASNPGSKVRGGRADDMYQLGLKKLRGFARDNQLGRFKWPKAGGSHAQQAAGEDLSSDKDGDNDTEGNDHGSDVE